MGIRTGTKVRWLHVLVILSMVIPSFLFPHFHQSDVPVAQAAGGTPSDIEGVWDLTWEVNADTTCDDATVGDQVTVRAVVSHETSSSGAIELFVPGNDNDPDAPTVVFTGQFNAEGDEFTASATYLRQSQELVVSTPADGDIDTDGSTSTITDDDNDCRVVSDLADATYVGSASVHTVCGSGCDYSDMQTAVDDAEEGDIIQVAGGTYASTNNYSDLDGLVLTQTLYISKSLVLRGGYDPAVDDADWVMPDPDANPTIIDNNDTGRGIYVTGTYSGTTDTMPYTRTRTIFTGITVQNGDALHSNGYNPYVPEVGNTGGGMYVVSSTLTILDSHIRNNIAHTSETSMTNNIIGAGGGLLLWDTNTVIRDSTIADNTSQMGGGLFALWSRGLTLSNNTISGNTATDTASDNANYTGDPGDFANIGNGGGIMTYISYASNVEGQEQAITLLDNTFTENTASRNGGGARLSMTTTDGQALIDGNTFLENDAGEDGGGLSVNVGVAIADDNTDYQTVVNDNRFLGNSATGSGGAGALYGADAVQVQIDTSVLPPTYDTDTRPRFDLTYNTIMTNTAEYGGGFVLQRSQGRVINNIFGDNTVTTGGEGSAFVMEGARTTAGFHNTIARQDGGDGSAVYLTPSAGVVGPTLTNGLGLINSIIAGHTVGVLIDANSGGGTLNYTLWGDGDWANGANTQGTIYNNNPVTGDPAFVDPASGDYHIGEGSAAIDAGLTMAAVTTDIDGQPRPQGDGYDIGADEFVPIPDVEGVWELLWEVNGDQTTCGLADGFQSTVIAVISQSGTDIEFYTTGYENSLPGPAVSLTGQMIDGNITVSTRYLRTTETINAQANEYGEITSATVTVTDGDGFWLTGAPGDECTISSNLVQATRIGDASISQVCPTVDAAQGCTFNNLQAAINATDSGGIVKVAAGTYSTINNALGSTQVAAINKDLTLRGGYSSDNWAIPNPASNVTTLDAQGEGRVITILDEETEAVVWGFTITNGDAAGLGDERLAITTGLPLPISVNPPSAIGGGIYVREAEVNLVENQITNNSALAAATDLNNGSGGLGGGVALYSSAAVIRDNTISGNTSQDGGGVYSFSSEDLQFNNNTIIDNYSSSAASNDPSVTSDSYGYGAGLTLFINLRVMYDDGIVAGNTGELNGGGLLIPFSFGPVLVRENVIYNNSAPETGGGLVIDNPAGGATVSGNKIFSNQGGYGGGMSIAHGLDDLRQVMLDDGNAIDIYNNMFYDNEATVQASGLFVESTQANVYHNTFAGHTTQEGSAIYAGLFVEEHLPEGFDMPSASEANIQNNLFAGNTVGVYVEDGNVVTNLDSSLWASGAWANTSETGGSGDILSQTNDQTGDADFIAPDSGNYHIGNNSAAIDSAADIGLDVDFDGDTRPLGDGPDIGADEARDADAPTPNLAGEWDLRWRVNGSLTTCNPDWVPDGTELTVRALVSQSDNDIEFFTVGYNNTNPADPAVSLTGSIDQSGVISVTSQYFRTTEELSLRSSTDQSIDSGRVVVTYEDGLDGPGAERSCILTSDLMYAKRLRDLPERTVCASGCDYTTIQDAINEADDGDMIKLVAGDYTTINNMGQVEGEVETAQIAYIDKDITLRGGYSTDNWIIPDLSANPTTLNPDGQGRAITVVGENTNAILTDLAITGGNAADLNDGSIIVSNGAPLPIEVSPGAIGGGVYARDGLIGIIGCEFTNNSALADAEQLTAGNGGYGGGLALFNANATVRDSTFTGNTSQDGAAVYSFSSQNLIFSNNNISDNLSTNAASDDENVTRADYGYGGGLTLFINLFVAFEDNTVSNNTGSYNGGGVLIPFSFGPVFVRGNTISGNSAPETGGGLVLDNAAAGAIISENIISDNSGGFGGGASIAHGLDDLRLAPYEVYNNIFDNNQASHQASGIFVESTEANIYHNTFVGHRDGDGVAVYVGLFVEEHLPATFPMPGSAVATLQNNIFADNETAVYAEEDNEASLDSTLWGSGQWLNTNTTDGSGLINQANDYTGDPAFVNPDANDYHIGETSAAIDMGVDTGLVTDIDDDIRPRGNGPDIGADEVTAGAPPLLGGQWELNWVANNARTTCAAIPDDMPYQMIMTLSQDGDTVEVFTTGYENTPAGPAVALSGQYASDGGSFVVQDHYLSETATMTATVSEQGTQGTIDTGMLTVVDAAQGCQVSYDLVSAQETGDANITTVCASGCDYTTIQEAIDAGSSGEIIKIAGGTYSGLNNQGSTLQSLNVPVDDATLAGDTQQVAYIDKDITLRGGYSTSNWVTPDPAANPTTVDALGLGRVLYITGNNNDATNAIVMDMTLTRGDADGLSGSLPDESTDGMGGGIYAVTSTLTLAGVTLDQNSAAMGDSATGMQGYGGGVGTYNSDLSIRDTTISNNNGRSGAGVAVVSGTELSISDSTISGNSTTGTGGGGYVQDVSGVSLNRTRITGNQAAFGGAFDAARSNVEMINSIVDTNEATTQGSGLRFEGSNASLTHNTIVGNREGDGTGIYLTVNGTINSNVIMTNTILVSHTTGINVAQGSNASLNATLWGGGEWANLQDTNSAGSLSRTGNYTGSVAFVDAASGNYHITPGSAAVNRGVDAGVLLDIDREQRPAEGGFDIGADETTAPERIYMPLIIRSTSGTAPTDDGSNGSGDGTDDGTGTVTDTLTLTDTFALSVH